MFFLGGVTGIIYMMLSPIWWLLFLGITIMIAVSINNRVGFLIILATLFGFHWLFGVFKAIPKELTWLPDIIIVALTGKMLFLQARQKLFKKTTIDLALLMVILLGLVSALYNNVSPITLVFGFRNFFKYVLMFYILRNIEHDEKFYRIFLISLFVLALLQIPVTIVQAIVYGNIGEDIADNISGTLGWKATGAMAIFMCFAIAIIIGFYTQTRKIIFLVLAASCMIPIILGSGQFGFYIVPPAFIICWFLGNQKSLKNILKIPILLAALSIFGLIGIDFHDNVYRGNLLESITSPAKFYQFNFQLRKEGTFGRFQVIDVANQMLAKNPLNLLIGFGPGNASESFFREYSGDVEKQFQGRKIGGIQFTLIILEFGYIGLLLFVFIFFCLLRLNYKFYNNIEDKFWRSIAVGYYGILFAYMAGIFYNPVWFYDVLAFIFWFISAALVNQWDSVKGVR